jgi:hypothetical protein
VLLWERLPPTRYLRPLLGIGFLVPRPATLALFG